MNYIIECKKGEKIATEVVRGRSVTEAVKALMNLLRVRGMPVNLKILTIKGIK